MKKSASRLVSSICLVVLLIMPTVATTVKAAEYFDEYLIPTQDSNPYDIVTGSDGNLWFTERQGGNIGRITPDGQITEFSIPSSTNPISITAGSDGALWFTETSGQHIGRISTDGTISEYHLPTGSTEYADIVAGPDGALWFSDWFSNGYNIGRLTTNGVFSKYPTSQQYGDVSQMTVGSDGALWMTRSFSGTASVSRMTTDGQFSEYSLPGDSSPQGITTGVDGALWFAEYGTDSIGRITTAGVVSQYQLPGINATPYDITAGSDGSLWVVEQSPNKIARMTTDGTVTAEYDAPYNSDMKIITNGSDGALWFTAAAANSIGRFTVPVASNLVLVPKNGTNAVGSTATFQATATNAFGNPVTDATIRFSTTGSIATSGSCVTDSTGQCSFNYQGPQLPGADAVFAYADTNVNAELDQTEPAATATQAWLLPTTKNGQVTGGGHIAGSQLPHDVAFGFVAKSDDSGVSGQCAVVDPGNNTQVKCISATVVTTDGNSATIFGDATINGQPTTYRIDITDAATPGTGNDTFALVTQSGYSVSGTLTSGNIRLH